tara:strand:+ start:22027 stop:23322 length:1296 start_codon:yes stop_codon:yes gene_type:complete
MSKKARWKISRDARKEETALGNVTAQASKHLESEKKWSKNMGMLGALLVPMAVATTVFTGGAAMPLWAGMLAAGGGALVGAKMGEEIAEAKTEGKIVWGEDKYSSRGKKGRDFRKTLTKGKFTKSAGVDLGTSLVTAGDQLDSGMLKDAGVAAAMAGLKGLGGAKGIKEGLSKGGKLTTSAGRKMAFGLTNEAGEKTGLKWAAQQWKDAPNPMGVKGAWKGLTHLGKGITKGNTEFLTPDMQKSGDWVGGGGSLDTLQGMADKGLSLDNSATLTGSFRRPPTLVSNPTASMSMNASGEIVGNKAMGLSNVTEGMNLGDAFNSGTQGNNPASNWLSSAKNTIAASKQAPSINPADLKLNMNFAQGIQNMEQAGAFTTIGKTKNMVSNIGNMMGNVIGGVYNTVTKPGQSLSNFGHAMKGTMTDQEWEDYNAS